MRHVPGVAGPVEGQDPFRLAAGLIGKRRTIEEGAILFERGDPARYVFFVVSGHVDVYRTDGRYMVVWSRGPGDGLSFDCGRRREMSCRAAERAELIAVDRRRLSLMAEVDDALATRLHQLHADELKIMLSTLGDVTQMRQGTLIEFPAAAARRHRLGGRLRSARHRQPAGSKDLAPELVEALS